LLIIEEVINEFLRNVLNGGTAQSNKPFDFGADPERGKKVPHGKGEKSESGLRIFYGIFITVR